MSCGGPLSAVMMVAGAGLIPGANIPGVGAALGVPTSLTSAIGNFTSLPITNQFSNIVTSATSVLGGGTLDSLRTLGAGTLPALTNAIPSGFTSALSAIAPGGVANGGLTGLISSTAGALMGGGDLSQFAQVFSGAQGFASQANQFINSTLNIGSISTTFGSLTGGMDNLITGGLNQVSQAFGALGGDMSKLGNLIDMNNLSNLGDPSALVRQLANVGGITPAIESVLRTAGLSTNSITDIATGGLTSLSATANKSLYEAMSNISGTDLAQIKNILGVTTPNIANMADLLNPAKILPTSFPTLTTPTPDGLRGIYATVDGAVNTNIEKYITGFGGSISNTISSFTGGFA